MTVLDETGTDGTTQAENEAEEPAPITPARALLQDARRVASSPRWPARTSRWVVAVIAFYLVVQAVFGSNSVSVANLIQGLALGSLYGIIGVGIILIYRTSRIINFAAGAIGAVPAILALLLDLQDHVSYLVVLPIALIGGPGLAAAVDVAVMRRFDRSPRLITTVVTIGVAQSLAVLGFFIPIWLGPEGDQRRIAGSDAVERVRRPQPPWPAHPDR